jgi:hypothetical protein
MALGRNSPLQNPNRTAPYDPQAYGQTQRNAPLPFPIVGGGGGGTVSTLYQIKCILQTMVSPFQTNPVGGPVQGCSQITNMYCVPTADIQIVPKPVAIIRCSIT